MAVGTERWPPCPSLIYLPEMASCQHCQCVSILHSSIASSRSFKHEYSTAKVSLSRPVWFWLKPDHSPASNLHAVYLCFSRFMFHIPFSPCSLYISLPSELEACLWFLWCQPQRSRQGIPSSASGHASSPVLAKLLHAYAGGGGGGASPDGGGGGAFGSDGGGGGACEYCCKNELKSALKPAGGAGG